MKKILIIEDDQIVANVYRNKLVVHGYQVEVAHTGEAGYDLIKSFRPDAVVLDLVLPKLSGVELMKMVRAEAKFAHLPMIVFSNTYLTNMVLEAWKAGATKCLSKASCTPRQVLDALGSVLGTSGPAAVQPVIPEPRAKLTAPTPAPVFDMEFETDVRGTFATTLPEVLNFLRAGLKALSRADNEADRAQPLQELARHTRTLASTANLAGFAPVAQLAEALEAMLLDLGGKPASVTASTLRTAATAVDCLGLLFDKAKGIKEFDVSQARILVVDDEAFSRRAITQALEKAKLRSTVVEDPNAGYHLLAEGAFDLIFLDVDMPGMNGYELCTRLRALPRHKTTPVVFVTGLNDFEARASSMMSGGNDFIAKPFHLMELAVKAIVHILRGKSTGSK
ncbi:MAG: response regulator [Verrucomicrobia subdivision 3 bacterium]|nr:response regulator [Verrucomicrobiota bacterium]MCC6823328.1 response regulator [Limisphaerales bacterium]